MTPSSFMSHTDEIFFRIFFSALIKFGIRNEAGKARSFNVTSRLRHSRLPISRNFNFSSELSVFVSKAMIFFLQRSRSNNTWKKISCGSENKIINYEDEQYFVILT